MLAAPVSSGCSSEVCAGCVVSLACTATKHFWGKMSGFEGSPFLLFVVFFFLLSLGVCFYFVFSLLSSPVSMHSLPLSFPCVLGSEFFTFPQQPVVPHCPALSQPPWYLSVFWLLLQLHHLFLEVVHQDSGLLQFSELLFTLPHTPWPLPHSVLPPSLADHPVVHNANRYHLHCSLASMRSSDTPCSCGSGQLYVGVWGLSVSLTFWQWLLTEWKPQSSFSLVDDDLLPNFCALPLWTAMQNALPQLSAMPHCVCLLCLLHSWSLTLHGAVFCQLLTKIPSIPGWLARALRSSGLWDADQMSMSLSSGIPLYSTMKQSRLDLTAVTTALLLLPHWHKSYKDLGDPRLFISYLNKNKNITSS